MEHSDTFGNWLRQRRRLLGMTQSELAGCAGCSVVTIRKFEADERRPSRQLAELLAGCLQIPAEERECFIRAIVLGNVAKLKMVHGELAGARADLDTVLELARPGGYTRLEMTAIFNEGLLRLLEGDAPAAP
ncbi:MAG: helix-turn-helix transcriptional regulator [Candidatus Promineofilum sp.]|nr:helix-turn-helix transcriptional regulator [Promineifilum sp.]MCW5863228.1 helix-turn-helix transcriptional regulator [Anaerolineae bacterium]